MPCFLKLNLPKKKKRKDKRRRLTTEKKDSVINSTPWRKLSHRYRQSNPLCEVHNHFGFITPSNLVDHIIPRSQGGAVWHLDNLCAMDKWIHDVKSGLETKQGCLVEFIETANGKIPSRREDIFYVLKPFIIDVNEEKNNDSTSSLEEDSYYKSVLKRD